MNWKKLIAVGTALTAIGVSMPTPLVQKCASLAAEVLKDDGIHEYGNLTYKLRYNWSDKAVGVDIIGVKSSAKGDIVIPDTIDDLNVLGVLFGDSLSGRTGITSITLPVGFDKVDLGLLPEGCKLKIADGDKSHYIKDGFLIKKGEKKEETSEASGTGFGTWGEWEARQYGDVVMAAIEPMSGVVTIPEGVAVCDVQFRGNADITEIDLPASLVYLPKYFCDNMPNLKEFKVAEGGKYFSYKGALGKQGNNWDKEYYDEETGEYVTPIGYYILAVPEGYEGEFVVDDGDELIFSGICFENIPNLTSVVLGKDTTFYCDGFSGCTSLEHIELNGETPYLSALRYVWWDYDESTGEWVNYDEPLEINATEEMFGDTKWYQDHPDGVLYCGATILGYKGTPDNEKIDVKEGTRTIVDYAFRNLNISEINVPASVEYMGVYSLDCPTLTAINVDKDNESYTSVDGVLYGNNMGMLKCYPQAKPDESLTIPDSVWWIAGGALESCNLLKHIDMRAELAYLGSFKGCPSSVDEYYASCTFDGIYFNCDNLVVKNPDCEIESLYNTKCTIVAPKGSNAEAFAKEHDMPFILLDDYEKDKPAAVTTTTAAPAAQTTTTTVKTTAASASSGKNDDSTKYGDANCDNKVTVADAVAILQFIGNRDKYPLSENGKKCADVDGVAGITGKDALVIQQVDAGLYKAEELPLKV